MDIDERLGTWRDAGLLSAQQAEAIAAHERERPPGPRAGRGRRSRVVEATGYVGAALAIGALALMLAERWDDLLVPARLALVGMVAALLLSGGLALRRLPQPAMRRLSSVLASASVGASAWLASIVAGDLLLLADRDAFLLVSATALVVALTLYLTRPSGLLQLATLVSLSATVLALLNRPALEVELIWFGLTFWVAGVVWILLGSGGWLLPRRVAEVSGGVLGLLAVQATAWDGYRVPMLIVGIATAGSLIGVAVAVDALHHLVVGAIGLFVLVPQLAFALFGDALGAPATLLVAGTSLVLLAVGLGRARQEVAGAPAGPDDLEGGERHEC